MKKEYLEHGLKEMQKTFSKIFLSEGLMRITPELLKENEPSFDMAVNHFILNTSMLPSPAQLLERVKFEGRQLRMAQGIKIEEESREQKRKEYEQGSILTRKAGSPLGKDWQVFMAHILEDDPRIEWPLLIAECREMHRKYPGMNFNVLANDWTTQYIIPSD